MQLTPTARALVDTYYDAWKGGSASFDETALRRVLAPDLRFEGPIAGVREGREPFLKGLAAVAAATTSFTPLRVVYDTEHAAALYDCALGPTGGTLRFAEFFDIRDDQIQAIRLLYDAAEFRRLTAT